ncbi:MAG TPA: hypothetical protein VGM10_34665 [Actinocrinis sp.]|jgi:hypothetical protein
MGSFFQVDLETLAGMTKSLGQAGDQMGSALSALGGAEGGNIGPDVLSSAASSFQSTWHYGLGQLQSSIQEVNEGVNKVHGAYQETENGVQQAMQKITGDLGA